MEPEPTDPPGGEAPAPGAPNADPPPAQVDPPADPPDKGGVQKRIDALTRKRNDAERDAAYWRGVAESKPAPVPTVNEPKPVNELDPHDFDSDADYLKAVANKTRDEIRQEFANDQAATQASETQRIMTDQYGKGRDKHEDFDDIALSQNLPISQDMLDAAIGENLSEVLYHLGKNPAEASRIASLPKIQQIKEIGKIESKVTANPTPKTITNTPNPPGTIEGGGSPSATPDEEKSQAELNTEWEKERRGQLGV